MTYNFAKGTPIDLAKLRQRLQRVSNKELHPAVPSRWEAFLPGALSERAFSRIARQNL